MTSRSLLIASIAAFALAAPLMVMPLFVSAQPAEPVPAVAVAAEPVVTATVAVDSGGSDEVTAEAIGDQIKEVVSKWRTVGILAGLAALVTLLIMILKLKRIDDLFTRWKIKWTKIFIASGLGGIGAGITAYLVDGDLVAAIVTGAAIVGPAAIGFFEALSKFLKRNRDSGKAVSKPE